jgi:FkbM family methyltransferase
VEPDLIYDVGLHDGDDTAYYLEQGFRVVGIEAHPKLAAAARRRFAPHIRAGRLTLLEVVVGSSDGVADFWLSAITEWSSTDRRVAARLGARHRLVERTSRRLGAILTEHGVPFYLKIDVETSGGACLEELDPHDAPPYVSVEFNDWGDLKALAHAGYDEFKLIHQADRLAHTQFRAEAGEAEQLRPAARTGPSGPFAENTYGKWETLEQTESHLRRFFAGETEFGDPPDWFIWFDIHARRQPV